MVGGSYIQSFDYSTTFPKGKLPGMIDRASNQCALQLKSWSYGYNKMGITRKISKILKKFLQISVQE